MDELRSVVEDFAAALDALRDFVTIVGPILSEREHQVRERAGKTFAFFRIAAAMAGHEDFSLDDFEEDTKTILVQAREKLIANAGDAEKRRREILKLLPLKVCDGKLELDPAHDGVRDLMTHRRSIRQVSDELRLLHESSLMALTSRSEWFFAQLFRIYLERYPEAVGRSEPFFSYETLAALRTIDEARDVLVEHRVEALMHGGLEDWLRFLREKPKLSMGYLDADMARIDEVFKRRNLVVHNGGKVSRRYIREIDERLRPDVKIDEVLIVEPGYVNDAINLIEKNFVLVCAEMWKKIEPRDSSRTAALLALSVQRLGEQKWDIARGLSYFVMNDKGQPEADQLKGRINYWQSFKWSGAYDEVRDEVNGWDFSAKSSLFQLAHAALKDDFGVCFSLIPTVLASGEIDLGALNNWPLFKAVRERPEFSQYLQKSEPGAEAQTGKSAEAPLN